MKVVTPSSIDSINSKMNQLNESIMALQKKQVILQDSLTTLNNSIQKAGIKTEFYTDQLNFQLFWFSLLIAIIGLVSWRTYISPINEKVKKIEEKELPEHINEINGRIEQKFEKFEEEYDELRHRTTLGISWGLKASKSFYRNQELWNYVIVFAMRHIELYFKNDIIETNLENLKLELEEVYNFLITKEITPEGLSSFYDEIIEIAIMIKKDDETEGVSDLGFKIYERLKEIGQQSHTELTIPSSN